MIYSLNGKLIFHDNNSAVVECSGVGYRCLITAKTLGGLPQLGEPVQLFTYLSVRQDGLDLFGFLTAKELDCFKLLTGINGVGPKMGLAILSQFAPEEIYAAIAAGDHKTLTAASGVGPKLAQRLVLELRDKIGKLEMNTAAVNTAQASAPTAGTAAEAVSALVALGFTGPEARSAFGRLNHELPVEQLIKQALALLSSGRL